MAGHGRAAHALDGVGKLARAALVPRGEHGEDLAPDRVGHASNAISASTPASLPAIDVSSDVDTLRPRIARPDQAPGGSSLRACLPGVNTRRSRTGGGSAMPGPPPAHFKRDDVRHGRPVEHAEQPRGPGARAPAHRGRSDHDDVRVCAGVEAVGDPHPARVADARRELGELGLVVDVGVLARGAAAAAAADGGDRSVGRHAGDQWQGKPRKWRASWMNSWMYMLSPNTEVAPWSIPTK